MTDTATTDKKNKIDSSGNEISGFGKWGIGTILIALTVYSALYIVGHWPDRLPTPRESIKPLYTYEWFHVKLVDSIVDPGKRTFPDSLPIIEKTGVDTSAQKKDTGQHLIDTSKKTANSSGPNKSKTPVAVSPSPSNKFCSG